MKTGENSHFEFLGQKVKILAYKCLIKLRRSWKLEEVHLVWRVLRVALGPTVVLTPEPTLWDVWFRRYEHFRKNFFFGQKVKNLASEPSWGPWDPWNCTGKFPDGLQSFRIVCKVSGGSGKFPDDLESFQMIWKVSGRSKKCPDHLENVAGLSKILQNHL